jgi:hypothetical protein
MYKSEVIININNNINHYSLINFIHIDINVYYYYNGLYVSYFDVLIYKY